MPILPTSRVVWGLDIAASAIKGVRMRLEDDRVRILDADILPIEGDPIVTESGGRDKRVWRALQSFEDKYHLSSERVVIGLPGNLFFTRPFSVFLIGNKTESDLVQFELEQHIPFGLDAVVWDYEVFNADDMTARERQGLIFAMKKEALNNYLLSLAAARIEPYQIQAAPLALWNMIKYEVPLDVPTVVADIGARSTNLVASDGKRYWCRTINQGGENLTAAVQFVFQSKNIMRDEAERIKRNMARIERRGELAERVMPAVRAYVGELRNSVTHLAEEHEVEFMRMLLFGGGSAAYGLQRLLSDELHLSVSIPAGLGRIECVTEEGARYVNEHLPQLATAIGLGLQGLGQQATRVNMVSATLARRKKETQSRRMAVAGLTAAIVLLTVFNLLTIWRTSIYGSGKEQVAQILTPVDAQLRTYNDLKNPGVAEKQLDLLAGMAEERRVWLAVLDKIARTLPENQRGDAKSKMWLMRLSLKQQPTGKYEAELDGGIAIRPDRNVDFVTNTLIVPLRDDKSGMFKNVSDILETKRSPTLSFGGGTGPEQFFLFKIRFDVVPIKGAT